MCDIRVSVWVESSSPSSLIVIDDEIFHLLSRLSSHSHRVFLFQNDGKSFSFFMLPEKKKYKTKKKKRGEASVLSLIPSIPLLFFCSRKKKDSGSRLSLHTSLHYPPELPSHSQLPSFCEWNIIWMHDVPDEYWCWCSCCGWFVACLVLSFFRLLLLVCSTHATSWGTRGCRIQKGREEPTRYGCCEERYRLFFRFSFKEAGPRSLWSSWPFMAIYVWNNNEKRKQEAEEDVSRCTRSSEIVPRHGIPSSVRPSELVHSFFRVVHVFVLLDHHYYYHSHLSCLRRPSLQIVFLPYIFTALPILLFPRSPLLPVSFHARVFKDVADTITTRLCVQLSWRALLSCCGWWYDLSWRSFMQQEMSVGASSEGISFPLCRQLKRKEEREREKAIRRSARERVGKVLLHEMIIRQEEFAVSVSCYLIAKLTADPDPSPISTHNELLITKNYALSCNHYLDCKNGRIEFVFYEIVCSSVFRVWKRFSSSHPHLCFRCCFRAVSSLQLLVPSLPVSHYVANVLLLDTILQ